MAREGYIGESLTALVTQATFAATDRVCRSIAEDARDTMHTAAAAATPSRTGIVRDSWLAHPIEHRGDVYEARIENPHWLAHLLAYGTQPHEIRPKGKRQGGKRAELTPEGPRAGAHVRGITAHHMPQIAVDTVAHTIKDTTYPAQRRFKADAELAIERAKRTHLR